MTVSSHGQKSSKSSSRRAKKPKVICVADFETTTDPTDCRIWSWGLVNIYDPDLRVDIDTTIESFCDHVAMMESPVVYFHNLKFDGMFILYHLLTNGFSYLQEGRMMCGEFSCVISKDGAFYSISVRWFNGNRVEFRDSLKKLPMPVARIAKSFKLPILKGSIDYHAPRPVGHVITTEEAEYLSNDVLIVAMAMKLQLDEGMSRLTVGSDSLAEFKHMMTPKVFSILFPVLCPSMDTEVRRAYRGGWTYADERYRGHVKIAPGKVYDVNSLYPSVMYDRMLPYGMPVFCEDIPEVTEEFPLYITTITFTAQLKPEHLPCITLKGSSRFTVSDYVKEIVEPITMTLTNVDYDLWMDHYDLDILSWEGSWLFRGIKGAFCEYIDRWMKVKETSEGGMREIAKLHLNSLYGKFATNPNVTGKFPYIDDDGCVALSLGPEEIRNPVYTPMGVFITAYARDVTIRAAQDNYDSFAYADTDSLHLFVTEHPALDIDPSRLGAWKHEMDFDSAVYIRAKCYSEHYADQTICNCEVEPPMSHSTGCGYVTHIAGVPLEIGRTLTFADFYNNHEFNDKLTARVVPGGVVLVATKWNLTDPSMGVDTALVSV